MTISLQICQHCGRRGVIVGLRCGRCGSTEIDEQQLSGRGVVIAATRTEEARFAVVGLDDAVRVLAAGPPGRPLEIGQAVTVGEDRNGTYRLLEEQQAPCAEAHGGFNRATRSRER